MTAEIKTFFKYVMLNICGMVGLSCYLLADTFFVSKGMGARGLTALNLAIPVYSFIHGSGLMFGMGGATKYSVFMGQGEQKSGDRVFTGTMLMAAVTSAAFVLTGVFLSEKIAVLLGADRAVLSMTRVYLRVLLLFTPMFMLNDTLLCFVRNDGSPALSMAAMLTGSLSNIILDYVFIFSLDMGIFGAALATGLAPAVSLIVLSRHWLTKQNCFHFIRARLCPQLMGRAVALGLPSLITELASGVVMIVFNAIILSLRGNIGVAAYGVVANLSLVVVSIYTGIAQGIQPILSRAYGAGNCREQQYILGYSIKTMLVVSAVIYLLFLLGANPIAATFNSEHNVQLQQIAVTGLRLYFTAVPFVGFNVIIASYFTSTGKALPAQAVSLTRGFLVIIPMAFLLSVLFKMTGVWLSFPFTEGLVAFIGIVIYKKGD